MNKVWKKLQENFVFDALELDYDMDEEEVLKYSPGNVLPVFIIYDGDLEIGRIIGEYSYLEMEEKFKEVGVDFCER